MCCGILFILFFIWYSSYCQTFRLGFCDRLHIKFSPKSPIKCITRKQPLEPKPNVQSVRDFGTRGC